jgi:Peptidase S24-like.
MKVLQNDFFFEEVKRIISTGESVEILVKGCSMSPYLKDGIDKVVLGPVNLLDINRGDIVLFSFSNSCLLHRIIKRKGDHLIIQGDGNLIKKENVLLSDIIGVVRFIIRPSGKCVSVDKPTHKLYWHCWLLLRPFRHFLFVVHKKLHTLLSRSA